LLRLRRNGQGHCDGKGGNSDKTADHGISWGLLAEVVT